MTRLEASLTVDALPAREQQIKAQQNQVAADRASLAEALEWQQKDIDSPRHGPVFDTLYREGEWVEAGNPVVSCCRRKTWKSVSLCPNP